MTFGDWLKRELERRNWSMADFATMVGVARSTVSRWLNENRTPEPSTCQRIAAVLGVPVDVVFEHAGHQDYAARPHDELRARIAAMEHRAAELMAEWELVHDRLEQARQELALLEEGMPDLDSPSLAAMSVVQDVEMPEETRLELERRLGTTLVKWEPHVLARRDTAPPSRRRAEPNRDTDNSIVENDDG